LKQKLINTLSAFGYPVFLQGTLNPEEAYPNTFITFFVDSTDDNGHYENNAISVNWYFSVIIYSDNPEIVNTKPDEIRAALKAAGFIPQGKGQDAPSDEPTHTGWAMDFVITEYLI
jgi:hypothetical protein